MRSSVTPGFIALTLLLVGCTHAPDQRSPETAAAAQVMFTPATIPWSDSAPGLPLGAKLALLVGDPSKTGPYVMRVQFPAGYRAAPHWHASDANVTVLSGIMSLGIGDTFDEATMKDLPAGSFYFVPPNTHQYLMAKTAATVQIHGIGPVGRIVLVNPADDPRTQAK
ncbi:MAG: cupin domain-containing protein [Steroidobacteraceae bacterium]